MGENTGFTGVFGRLPDFAHSLRPVCARAAEGVRGRDGVRDGLLDGVLDGTDAGAGAPVAAAGGEVCTADSGAVVADAGPHEMGRTDTDEQMGTGTVPPVD